MFIDIFRENVKFMYCQVVKSRRLQISTVEALFHETRDLFEKEEAKEVFLKTFITLTECQLEQLGLAMRDTFFSVRSLDFWQNFMFLNFVCALFVYFTRFYFVFLLFSILIICLTSFLKVF